MDPVYMTIACIVIGVATGAIAALCGVGGGIIMVPAFVFFLKMDQKTAVATSLAAILMTSLAASTKNHGANLIDWRVALTTGLSAAIVAWFAAGWLKALSSPTLAKMFAVLMIVVGIHMLWSSTKPSKTAPAKTPDTISADRS